jgi:nicotinate-nucleotide adenylyltransferase
VRIGLFGGSFDPPHQGHLALARTALQQLALDELRWLPAGQPWQKPRELAGAGDRRALVAEAIAGEPRFLLDARELERTGPSYTIDSVRELRAERPGAELFLVIGQDQYAGLASWRDWEALLDAVTLAVAARAGQSVAPPPALAARPHRVLPLQMPPVEASSTAIRAHLAAGHPVGDLVPGMVPDGVARYIESHRLYRQPPPPPRS